MKIIGIVCDNYKVERFKKELEAQEFETIKFFPGKETTVIQVHVSDFEFHEAKRDVAKVANKVEFHFKRAN